MYTDYLVILMLLVTIPLPNGLGLKFERDRPNYSFDGDDNSVGIVPCVTTTNGRGVCVHIYECPNYKDLILSRLKPKICNWSGRVPVICCPVVERPKQPTPDPDPEPVTAMNKVHRNRQKNNCGTRLGVSRDVSRIVGGDVAYQGEFPWNAAVFIGQLSGSFTHECGASIISDRYILSAAHCFGNLRPSNYLIGIGSNDLSSTVKYQVEEIIVHPDYDKNQFYHDIALVRLKEPLTFSENVRPICLPFDYLTARSKLIFSPYNQTVTVSGWGYTSYEGGERSNILLKADLNLMPREMCNKAYSALNTPRIARGITDEFICAGTPDGSKDACQSDSGGPLIAKLDTNEQLDSNWEAKFVQIGIVSFGFKCGVRGYPGVYVNVHKYLDWITKSMQEPTMSTVD